MKQRVERGDAEHEDRHVDKDRDTPAKAGKKQQAPARARISVLGSLFWGCGCGLLITHLSTRLNCAPLKACLQWRAASGCHYHYILIYAYLLG